MIIREKKQNHKFSLVQFMWILGALSLLVGSVISLYTPNDKLLGIYFVLGFLMLIAGVINIFVYIQDKNPLDGAHWIIADGLSTTFLALFPLLNQVVSVQIIPFFFGAWELFSGIIKIVECIELQDYNLKGWKIFLAIGSVELFSGISSMIKPVDDLMGIHIVVSIIFLFQALGFVFKIMVFGHISK